MRLSGLPHFSGGPRSGAGPGPAGWRLARGRAPLPEAASGCFLKQQPAHRLAHPEFSCPLSRCCGAESRAGLLHSRRPRERNGPARKPSITGRWHTQACRVTAAEASVAPGVHSQRLLRDPCSRAEAFPLPTALRTLWESCCADAIGEIQPAFLGTAAIRVDCGAQSFGKRPSKQRYELNVRKLELCLEMHLCLADRWS